MKLHLRVVSGMQIGDQARIEPPGGLIGRGEGCAFHLRDESISRSHMELRYQQDGWWAVQHSARSPSLVDGVPVGSSPLLLRERGVLQVGKIAIEYVHDRPVAVVNLPESPPTMINVRRQLPTIQHAVLPQMTPMRAVDPAPLPPLEAPPTLIIRRPPLEPSPAPLHDALPSVDSPPTLIRRPPPKGPPPIPPHLRETPAAEPKPDAWQQVEAERDQLRRERDQLSSEVLKLSEDNAALREAAKRQPAAAPAGSRLTHQALELLGPFSDSLEQATAALQEGDASRARTLLREASFGLADLRDLFESAGS